MKKLSVAILLAVFSIATTGVPQAQTESEVAVARANIQADRQAIVAANLPMTETEAAAFWPVYRAYRTEVMAIGDKTLRMITAYANSYKDASVTDDQGLALTKEYLKLQKDAIALKETYISEFKKVLPGKSVMRFYQIENKLDVLVTASAAAEVPLVE